VILGRIIKNVTERNWSTVVVELLVVVVGIFLGLQVTEWHDDRQSRADGYYYLDLLRRQLDNEIALRETDLAELSVRIDQIENAYDLLHADHWSEEEFAEFESDHVAIYRVSGESRRPSALRQLVDNGKIDLIESRDVQEMLFGLDRAYWEAISQSDTTARFLSEATVVVTEEIPYGTRGDVMALPNQPDILLESDRLKFAMRWFVIMNGIQRGHLTTLQNESIRARDELTSYLSSQSAFVPHREDSQRLEVGPRPDKRGSGPTGRLLLGEWFDPMKSDQPIDFLAAASGRLVPGGRSGIRTSNIRGGVSPARELLGEFRTD
jgi:hypothetical protein